MQTCLLYCMIPMQGKTHVHEAGRISLSANPIHCNTFAASLGVRPRKASLETAMVIAIGKISYN